MRKPGLFYKIEAAVAFAEEVSSQSDRWVARKIGDELVPALLEARTYIEVGQVSAPEIKLALSRAALVASGLADTDPNFAPLFSRLRVLQEDAATVSRAMRR